MQDRCTQRRKIALKTAAAGLIVCLLAGTASSRAAKRSRDIGADGPEAEFHMARMIYKTFGGGGSRGFFQPWWAICR